jgi:hypothetical protein
LKSGEIPVDKDAKDLRHLNPEEKVVIAIDMTDGCVRVCAAGIRAQCPDISEAELNDKLRKRLEWSRRLRKREG